MKRFLALTVLLTLPGMGLAHEYSIGDLDINHLVIFETAATAKAGGGYLVITNTGENEDALIDVKADFPRVMIHQTTQTNGIARMSHVGHLDIPAGETVDLVPGGYHIMFMGLDAPFEVGQSIPATLVFENAGEVEVTFKVKKRTAGDPGGHEDHSDHSGHGHSD